MIKVTFVRVTAMILFKLINLFNRRRVKNMNYEFMKKFKPSDYTLKETKYWLVILRQKQVTLGAVIIVPKRQISSFAEINTEEASELPSVISWYENTASKLYHPDKFNYVAAMMKDPFAHFHGFPRYSREVEAYDLTWKDEYWPGLVKFAQITTDEGLLGRIRNDMKE